MIPWLTTFFVIAMTSMTLWAPQAQGARGPHLALVCEAMMSITQNPSIQRGDALGAALSLQSLIRSRLNPDQSSIDLEMYDDANLVTNDLKWLRSGDGRLEAVYGRLSTLVEDMAHSRDGATFVGFEIRGSENILRTIHHIRGQMARAQQLATHPGLRQWLQLGAQTVGDAGWLAFNLAMTNLSFSLAQSGDGNPLAMIVAGSAFATFGIMPALMSYHIGPQFAFDRDFQKVLDHIENSVQSSQKGAFAFHSKAVRVPIEFHNSLMSCSNSGEEVPLDVRRATCQLGVQHWTSQHIPRARRFLNPELDQLENSSRRDVTEGDRRDVYLDQGFFFDRPAVEDGYSSVGGDQAGEPVWFLSYRAFRQLPERPRRPRKDTKQQQSPVWDWGLQPVGVRR